MRESARKGRPGAWYTAAAVTLVFGSLAEIYLFALLEIHLSRWIEGVSTSSLVLLQFPILGGIVAASAYLANRGRRIAVVRKGESPPAEDRPAVLYLRPFQRDRATARVGKGPFPIPTGFHTVEEQLVFVLRDIGEVWAVGRPGEALPRLGARRVYFDDHEWPRKVPRLMEEARLVVMAVGHSEGVLFELEKAREMLEPGQLALLSDHESVEAVRDAIRASWGQEVPLPDPGQRARKARYCTLLFDADWRPRWGLGELPRVVVRGYLTRPEASLFRYALRPLFDHVGASWTPPPVPWLFLVFCLVLFGGLAGSIVVMIVE